MAIKDEIIPIDIADLQRLHDKTSSAKEQIQDKDTLLFMGDTGSGKTTTIKALLGYRMGWRKWNGTDYITIAEPVEDEIVRQMVSNPDCESNTRTVIAIKPKGNMTKQDIFLTDTPGFRDTDGKKEDAIN